MERLKSYLELGLVGMARGGQLDWFDGHYGAALLAGYYMAHENELPEHVLNGLVRTCEMYRSKHVEWFAPMEPEEDDPSLLDHVINALKKNGETLRSSGHGFALGLLGLKALRDCPELITPSIVDGLVKMLESTTEDRPNRYWGVDNYFDVSTDDVCDIPSYKDSDQMVKQALVKLNTVIPNQVIQGQRYFFSGEKEHGITHAHALLELEKFGFQEIVESGMRNHRVQMYLNRQGPDFIVDEIKEPLYTSIVAPEYWGKTFNDPHAIKVPYAALNLLNRLDSSERAEAEVGICKLLSNME